MGKAYIHTPIGIINACDKLEGFEYGERPGIVLGKERIIKSCLTKVIITTDQGESHSVEPVLVESCMNPQLKTIIPITVTFAEDEAGEGYILTVENNKKTVRINMDKDNANIKTAKYNPQVKKSDCAKCNNCGRC